MMQKIHPSGRNIGFDFFRGAMALWVAAGHFFFWQNAPKIPLSFILAVDFFLVLSGWVLCASVFRQGDKFDSVRFAKNRWLRLFPVYSVCCLLTVPLAVWHDHLHGPNLFDIARFAAIAQMLPFNPMSRMPNIEPLGISYTISAELWVGIFLFPLLVCIGKYCRQLLFPLLMLLIIACLLVLNIYGTANGFYMNVHYMPYYPFLYAGIIRCIMDYSIGILAYILIMRVKTAPAAGLSSALQLLCLAVFAIVYCKLHYVKDNEFLAPFLFAGFIACLSFKSGIIYAWTSGKLGAFLGDISYPLYLIHPLLIYVSKLYCSRFTPPNTADNLSLWAILPVYLCACIALSYCIHRLVEKPCLKLLK